jgi:hypothetical protein
MAFNNVADIVDALDDNALFAAAVAPDEPSEQPQQSVTQGEPPQPPQGGMAVTEQQTIDQPQGDQAPPQDEFVPSWRLREEREAREAYAGRLAERDRQLSEALNFIRSSQAAASPPPPPPDPVVDPAAFHNANAHAFAALHQDFQNQLRTVQLENNLQLTRMEVGPELFEAAYHAFIDTASGDQAFARAVVGAPNPGAAMIDWYRQAATLQRIGPDPDAWFDQRKSELLQDPEFLAQAVEAARNYQPGRAATASSAAMSRAMPSGNMRGAPTSNVTVLPPSLMRMRGSGSTEVTAANFGGDNNPLSDESLFAFATKQR